MPLALEKVQKHLTQFVYTVAFHVVLHNKGSRPKISEIHQIIPHFRGVFNPAANAGKHKPQLKLPGSKRKEPGSILMPLFCISSLFSFSCRVCPAAVASMAVSGSGNDPVIVVFVHILMKNYDSPKLRRYWPEGSGWLFWSVLFCPFWSVPFCPV